MDVGTPRKRKSRPLPQHGSRGRVRSGCLTCRARRVKCDELRPICHNCSRLHKTCIYQQRIVRAPFCLTRSEPEAQCESTGPSTGTTATLTSTPDTIIHADANVPFSYAFQGHDGGRDRIPTSDSPCNQFQSQDAIAIVSSSLSGNMSDSTTMAVRSGSEPLAALISRDIDLTTAIDIVAVCDVSLQPIFSFFLDKVDCPLITPYDEVNWSHMKQDLVELGSSCPAIASSISALSTLYRSQLFNLPSSGHAVSLYNSAKVAYQTLLNDRKQDFSVILAVIFLLCLFEVVHYETTPILKEPGDILLNRLSGWTQTQTQFSSRSSRIIAWLRLLHTSTVRGGGMGLISDAVVHLLPDCKLMNTGNSSDKVTLRASTQIYDVLSAPIFDFYSNLQGISGQIARLTHYHRSRATGMDQEEVAQKIADITSQLHALWESRCSTQRQTPKELRACLAPTIAESLIKLIGICAAAYYSEFIEVHRVLRDPTSESLDSQNARIEIRRIIGEDWNAYEDGGKLNPGYLRPLFLCAIEGVTEEEVRWAVERLEEIKNPISRSEFFACFGRALSAAQLQRGRRVTSKYFCIWQFGVSPPFL